VSGLYTTAAGMLHVSPGTGTTFVPLRFFARPEVTELVLRPRSSGASENASPSSRSRQTRRWSRLRPARS
jgi:hypothetical protein